MRCYEFAKVGDGYRLELRTRPDPVPAADRVVVRVRATSLNYRDLIHLQNKAGRDVSGRIPLSDGAGEVVAVGSDVTVVRVGDRVTANFFTAWERGRFDMKYHASALGGPGADGMLAELVDLPASALVPIPEYLSFEEAACLPCAAVTAWSALMDRGRLQKGDTVLALGTGGVSIFALQLGVAADCPVVVTSSSDEKLERAAKLGAANGINYRTHPDWEKEVHRLTGKHGVDHVVEVGGGGTLTKSLASVAAGGHVALIGVLTGFGPPQDSLFPLVSKNATLSGIYVGSRENFVAMNEFLTAHQIRPVIDRAFAFAEATAAFAHLESGSHFGKIVVRLP
ncbi:zinc-dependent alcohol dehydrogenase family protein [Limnoglobus roseus]|uniref:NAD(P)-dependent alcohol dehydrogenase n=1 Tax=Limnoglobus roseus TaxID=2598579 RepID=A0A5C1AJ80_9BACT|nr:NAD(P)-dependent alcohol dehydrogenase [Limnoglobus roseus]QEL17184.1 NAD(P)-dependent alcohol dehydrogenase [Limnoglobus roseus]